MKKTLLKTTMLAAIASLTMSGYVSAHHMSSENMPDEQYIYVDSIISDQHNEIIDAMLNDEDEDLMGSTSRGMDGGTPTMADGDGANETMSASQSMASTDSQSVAAPGRGTGSSMRTSSGR